MIRPAPSAGLSMPKRASSNVWQLPCSPLKRTLELQYTDKSCGMQLLTVEFYKIKHKEPMLVIRREESLTEDCCAGTSLTSPAKDNSWRLIRQSYTISTN